MTEQAQQIPTWLGLTCLIGSVIFIIFAFRQGFRVKPRNGDSSVSDTISLIRDNNIHHP